MDAEVTYCSELKAALAELPVKQRCCKAALLTGLLYFKAPEQGSTAGILAERLEVELGGSIDRDASSEPDGLFACEGCAGCFLRGVFLCCGTVTDPETEYRLEFPMISDESAFLTGRILDSCGISPKLTSRRGRPVIYLKESTSIEDLLSLIGAKREAFELMNLKIKRELRNNANRQTNCDAANIQKTVSASEGQLEAIRYLLESGRLDTLPDELKSTALIRLENSSLSLAELVSLHTEKISRSGVNHRLKKIMEIAAEMRERKN